MATDPRDSWADRIAKVAFAQTALDMEPALCNALAILRDEEQKPGYLGYLRQMFESLATQLSTTRERVLVTYLRTVVLFDAGKYGICERAVEFAEQSLANATKDASPEWLKAMHASLSARSALLSWRMGRHQKLEEIARSLLGQPWVEVVRADGTKGD